jgi:5-methylcytosine-specific restriction endonuclease McrA
MTKKATIPKALREQVWLKTIGKKYENKCYIPWCQNKMTVFDFHVGHNLPESKGGTLDIDNLEAICARCNQSMSDKYTIDEWIKFKNYNKWYHCLCFSPKFD